MVIDIRTPKEIARDQLHRKVINDFLALRESNPTASTSRLLTKVGELNNLTSMGVRGILERNKILN